jgi:S-(hydroxymethyl)glutathione dehydrogenase / alcohol dehydrogenase
LQVRRLWIAPARRSSLHEGSARGRTDVPRIVDWYMDGRINIDDLITHVMPLERINEGFDLMHRGESIRSVVVY